MSGLTPKLFESSYCCPHCGVVAHQTWHLATSRPFVSAPGAASDTYKSFGLAELQLHHSNSNASHNVGGIVFSECQHCSKVALWAKGKLVLPNPEAATPHPDMPESASLDFREAAAIAQDSPRGAAALLRLALEKLCHEIGDPSKKIDTNIATFVANGLNSNVTKAMDSLRVIGNEAVHPGAMDLRDDLATVTSLFQLLNFIVENVISQPNRIAELFDSLPEAKKQGIENRDKKNAKE